MLNSPRRNAEARRGPLVSRVWLIAISFLVFAGCGNREQHQAIEELRKSGAEVNVNARGDAYWVDLHGAPVTATVVGAFRRTPHVQTLLLAGTRITDADLSQLETLTDLETLDLSYTRVTGAGLASLRKLGHLTTLSLNGTRLGQAAVDPLRTLIGLKGLSLVHADISAQAVKQLQDALPGCVIVGP